MTDREIIELFLARSERAIEALAAAYGRLIRRIAWNILRSDEDAEECAQDTYMAAWETIPPKEPDPLTPYVGRLSRNFALDRYRYAHAARRAGTEVMLSEIEEIVSGTEGAEDAAMRGALTDAISAFLYSQKEADRRLFVRRYFWGESVEGLAHEMGVRPGSAAVRLHRIRARLKEYLEKEGFDL